MQTYLEIDWFHRLQIGYSLMAMVLRTPLVAVYTDYFGCIHMFVYVLSYICPTTCSSSGFIGEFTRALVVVSYVYIIMCICWWDVWCTHHSIGYASVSTGPSSYVV